MAIEMPRAFANQMRPDARALLPKTDSCQINQPKEDISNLADLFLDSCFDVVRGCEILRAGSNRHAQVRMFRVLAAARFASADVRLNRNVVPRVQFAIEISRNQFLSFFTTHIVCLFPRGSTDKTSFA